MSEVNDPPTRPNAIVDSYSEYDDEAEESTQVKHVPQELIEASAPAVQGEDAHFREVFEKFIATQKECGASVTGLTFDKFVRKLHAARDQVMKRHNAPCGALHGVRERRARGAQSQPGQAVS